MGLKYIVSHDSFCNYYEVKFYKGFKRKQNVVHTDKKP